MKEPQYSSAIKRAWQLTWHHKDLWVFGLFAAFLGQMGIVDILGQSTLSAMNIDNPSGFLYVWYLLQDLYLSFAGFSFGAVDYVGAMWLILLLVVLGVGILYVSVVSQGALVHSAARYARSRMKKMTNIHASWHDGRKNFWRLLFLNLIRKIVVIGTSSCVVWGTVNALYEPRFSDHVLYLIIFLLAVVVGMVMSIWLMYTIGYVIVEEYKLIPAMRNGWRLFKDHWLVSFEIGSIILLLNVVLFFVLVVGLFFFFLPTFFMWSLAISLGGSVLLMTVGLMMGVVLFSLFAIFMGTLFTTFTTSVWTYMFVKMHKHGVMSHVVHLFHGDFVKK